MRPKTAMTVADAGYKPPRGIEAYLTGPWSYLRQLDDRRLGTQGSLIGIGRFRPAEDGLTYDERGHMAFAGIDTIATRRYRYSFPTAHRAQVCFDDGRAFHMMDLTDGQDRFRHHCAPDLYEGHCLLLTKTDWRLEWRVTGPRKDLWLTTHYRRFDDPLGCFGLDPV